VDKGRVSIEVRPYWIEGTTGPLGQVHVSAKLST